MGWYREIGRSLVWLYECPDCHHRIWITNSLQFAELDQTFLVGQMNTEGWDLIPILLECKCPERGKGLFDNNEVIAYENAGGE